MQVLCCSAYIKQRNLHKKVLAFEENIDLARGGMVECLWYVPWRELVFLHQTTLPSGLRCCIQKTFYLGPGWPSVTSSVRYNLEKLCRRILKALSFTPGDRSSIHKLLWHPERMQVTDFQHPQSQAYSPCQSRPCRQEELQFPSLSCSSSKQNSDYRKRNSSRIRLYNTCRALRPSTILRSIHADVLPVSSEVKGFTLWPGFSVPQPSGRLARVSLISLRVIEPFTFPLVRRLRALC